MKITYKTSFNFGMPPTFVPDGGAAMQLPTVNTEMHMEGSVELTPEEYEKCLAATVQAAKEAADVWRPIAADIVKSIFTPPSFKEFCSRLWEAAKNALQ